MIDSEATNNFISPDVVHRLHWPVDRNYDCNISLGTGVVAHGEGVCHGIIFQLAGVRFVTDFIVLELGNADMILGIQWLFSLGDCNCNWETNHISFVHKERVVTLVGERNLHKSVFRCHEDRYTHRPQAGGLAWGLLEQTEPSFTASTAPPVLVPILHTFQHVFRPPSGLPPRRNHEHAITLLPGSTVVLVRPYRYPHAHKHIIEDMVQDMLKDGIIRKSSSPFSSPVLLVPKKDKTWRFCVDYRALNRATIPNKFPIPVIDQLLDELHGSAFYTKLDLRAGYHQIRMKEEDIYKTAFRTHEGHYEILVMPFGLTNAPASFQSLMNSLFQPLLRRCVLVFFDDILVFSKTLAEHGTHLQEVLRIFTEHRLFANLKKCLFGKTSMDYLGHIISHEGVSTDPQKTAAIRAWPAPRSVKELRGFFGLTGYYRRFIKGYGTIAKPLTELLKKDQFKWTMAAQVTFELLKQEMCNAPTLRLPNFDELFTVETDASNTGSGAVLLQAKQPIAFFSYALKAREQLKSAYERELMAIVMALSKWKHYLLGRHFVVTTDQQSLKYLLEQRDVSLEYQCWLLKLMPFDFDIRYKPGTTNRVADGLSRIPQAPTEHLTHILLNLTMPQSLQLADILKEVDTDDKIQALRIGLENGSIHRQHFSVKQNRVWYKDRLLIPKTSRFIPLLLHETHSSLIGGHFGVLKTIKALQRLVHWEGLKTAVRKYVAECPICQTHKTSTLSPAGLLQPLPIPTAIWEDISMDFIEGLPISNHANVILVVVDRLSKFAHFMTLKHPFSSQDVVQVFLFGVVRIHGFPKTIISDRDRIFLSGFWRELFKLSDTKLAFSTAYHPETDGQTEVLNRCLETYLRCFCSSQPRSWNKFLLWAEYSYNTSFHRALNTTPFRVVFGRDPPQLLKFEDGSTTNYALETVLKERDAVLAEVREHLLRAQQQMEKSANKHRRHVEFQVGQWVYLKLQAYRQQSVAKRICHKLAARFYGPFEILQRIGKVAYKLKLLVDSKIHDVFHIFQLKEAPGSHEHFQPLPPMFTQSDHVIIEPDSVLSTRYNAKGQLEALIQWKGLTPAENEWILVASLLQQFPNFELGDKLSLKGGSIDKPLQVYVRKNRAGTEKMKQLNQYGDSAHVDKGVNVVAGEKKNKRKEKRTALWTALKGEQEEREGRRLVASGYPGDKGNESFGEELINRLGSLFTLRVE